MLPRLVRLCITKLENRTYLWSTQQCSWIEMSHSRAPVVATYLTNVIYWLDTPFRLRVVFTFLHHAMSNEQEYSVSIPLIRRGCRAKSSHKVYHRSSSQVISPLRPDQPPKFLLFSDQMQECGLDFFESLPVASNHNQVKVKEQVKEQGDFWCWLGEATNKRPLGRG